MFGTPISKIPEGWFLDHADLPAEIRLCKTLPYDHSGIFSFKGRKHPINRGGIGRIRYAFSPLCHVSQAPVRFAQGNGGDQVINLQ